MGSSRAARAGSAEARSRFEPWPIQRETSKLGRLDAPSPSRQRLVTTLELIDTLEMVRIPSRVVFVEALEL